MGNIAEFEVGDRVHYTEPTTKKTQNGKIKEILENSDSEVRVVYNCDGRWSDFMDYTSQLTKVKDLELGWKYE